MSPPKKDKPDHSQLPNNYIFTGYYKKGKLVTKVKTIPNLLVFAEDPNAACHVEGEPIVLRTNENGVLHGLSLNKKTLLASEMPYSHKFNEKGEPIILNAAFPPMEAAAYLALEHGVNWQQEFIKAMKNFKGNKAKPNKLKLEKIKYSQLEKPDNKETEYKK